MSRKARTLMIAALILVMLAGVGCIVYPLFASWYTERHRSGVIADHRQELEKLEDAEISAAREEALEYNRQLASGGFSPEDHAEHGYYDLLNIAGDGIMGYVEIPKISVRLPIYHSSGSDALADGAGHMPQTSLPVGGADTHTVITAHTGMTTSAMFTDLHQMEIGDVFFLTVLGVKMAYQVDQTQVVLPEDVDGVFIQEGQDLATLLTCTPYGINSHRLLVRGHRITLSEEIAPESAQGEKQSYWMQQYLDGILNGLWLALIPLGILAAALLIRKFTLRRKKKNAEQR